ncbi:SCO2525 family SAM-dependent methyltransferase [Actinomadura adrarensis]|uniref:SCO2525 family SAM-dependent methyltransferase n=1 Tax=Actinomadura adrarensis TaxID=1819600 RepID=A0ABW3CSW9_9ACTN
MGANAEFEWNEFDSDSYVAQNYAKMLRADRKFIEIVRDFFAARAPGTALRGVDVGTGANLYPALLMLPFCEEITLIEYSRSNVRWLHNEISEPKAGNAGARPPGYSQTWDPYWNVLSENRRYRSVGDPRRSLTQRSRIEQGSIFDLSTDQRQWDIGTMFFVAESISRQPEEFRRALHAFIGALRPGALFAAAFMEKSDGYQVGDRGFPAVQVTEHEVRECLAESCQDVHFDHHTAEPGLRTGYTGMIIAYGRR